MQRILVYGYANELSHGVATLPPSTGHSHLGIIFNFISIFLITEVSALWMPFALVITSYWLFH